MGKLNFRNPSIDDINDTPIRASLKGPRVKSYDGTGYPGDHVSNFQWAIKMIPMNPKLRCLYFTGTLDGLARYLLASLPSRSIDSFEELCSKFYNSFIQKQRFQQQAHLPKAVRNFVEPATTAVVGFVGQAVWPEGRISLPFTLVEYQKDVRKTILADFIIIKSYSPYSMLLGRTKMYQLRDVPSIVHGLLKFPSEHGIITLRNTDKHTKLSNIVEPPQKEKEASASAEEEEVILVPKSRDQLVRIGMELLSDIKHGLTKLLARYADVFAWRPWRPEYMSGIPRSIIEHYLNLNPGFLPIKHKKRIMASKRNVIVNQESLNGKMADLGRFLVKSKEQSLPFFRSLKNHLGKGTITWMEEAEESLVRLKAYLENLPTLASPKVREPLIVYLSASREAISVVLVAKRSRKQVSVYFLRRVLQEADLNYSIIVKLTMALVYTMMRLRRYFLAHPTTVLSNQPIKQILMQPECSGRITRWSIELVEYDVTYRPGTSLKAQSLVEFLTEIPYEEKASAWVVTTSNTEPTKPQSMYDLQTLWTMYTDGALSQNGSGAGIILISPNEDRLTYALRFNFNCLKNEAEYEGFLAVLQIVLEVGVQKVRAFIDSRLVANQINGSLEAKKV
ncbi:unnamed protein product [Lactuca virosa]|uniref:RNase H type-1 domain-containing protein n=1 Tax=Lactuca virosa TaxID=75947 RepID=A0AAU9MSF4_9ASTR|nr:unnamed protein product [Lactuca virosa]